MAIAAGVTNPMVDWRATGTTRRTMPDRTSHDSDGARLAATAPGGSVRAAAATAGVASALTLSAVNATGRRSACSRTISRRSWVFGQRLVRKFLAYHGSLLGAAVVDSGSIRA